MSDDDDMYRQCLMLYVQANMLARESNMLAREFYWCSDDVKISVVYSVVYCPSIGEVQKSKLVQA